MDDERLRLPSCRVQRHYTTHPIMGCSCCLPEIDLRQAAFSLLDVHRNVFRLGPAFLMRTEGQDVLLEVFNVDISAPDC